MHDYTTPLQQLLALLASAISTGKQLTYEQVFCIFLFLRLLFVSVALVTFVMYHLSV